MADDIDNPESNRKLRKAIADNIIFRLLSQVIVAVIYVLLVRLLSEEDFGLYQLFYAIPPVIASLFSLGIAVTLSRYLPEYFAAKKFGDAAALLRWAMRLRLFFSVLILGIVILLWDAIAPLLKIEDYKRLFLIFCAVTVTLFQCRLLVITLSSYLLQQWSMGLTAAFSFFKVCAYLGIAVYGFTLEYVLIADLAAYLFYFVGLRWAQKRFIPWPETAEPFPKDQRKRVIRFGIFNNFNDLGTLTLNSRSDNLFIAALLSPLYVGAYAFCTQLEMMVQKMLPTRFFRSVIHAVVFKLDQVTESERATQYFAFLLKLNYLSILPVFVAIAAFPEAIINIVFGGKFLEFSYVLVSVFAFTVLSSFQQPVNVIAQLGERAGIILASKIFAIYNIVANLVLIPKIGIMGAVIATGTAVFFKNTFIWFFVRETATLRGTGRFFLQQLIWWGAMYALLRWVNDSTSDWVTLGIGALVIPLASLVSLRLGAFSDAEREIFGQLGGAKLRTMLLRLGILKPEIEDSPNA